jgi:hypothetical protein
MMFKSISALIECLKYSDNRNRERATTMTDAELREKLEREALALIAGNSELAARLLTERG